MTPEEHAAFLREERAEIQRMDEINDRIAEDEERRERDPDDMEGTLRLLEKEWQQ